ncbi:MAG: aerotolerance regulator BatA [Phycisphaerae bacterium]|nr:MAG: aerotolerance regulator BatA [Phycisphaerae bacterium]
MFTGITFDRPMMLTLLALVPLVWWRWRRQHRHAAIRFSSLENLRMQGRSWAVRMRFVIPTLRSIAVIVMVVCLARPQKGDEETRIVSEGVAIQLLVDRSGSMRALDFKIDGKPVNRLEAVKHVATQFVQGDEDTELGGRPDDLIGMITFAAYADSRCPLTLDHAYLADTLQKTKIVAREESQQEDGTAIGDAIALGVLRMEDMTKRREALNANRIKSKVLVLLTDGQQMLGDLTPQQGADLAQAADIKVYTIGVGSRGKAKVPDVDFMGRKRLVDVWVNIDEPTLKEIAKTTGGEYFRATDTESLRKIYARIDELEKTETEEKRYLQHAEMATQWVSIGPLRYPPLLLVALLCLALEVVLTNTRFRKIP